MCLCHIPTLHHYDIFPPPGGNVTGGNLLGGHDDDDDDDDDGDHDDDDDDCDLPPSCQEPGARHTSIAVELDHHLARSACHLIIIIIMMMIIYMMIINIMMMIIDTFFWSGLEVELWMPPMLPPISVMPPLISLLLPPQLFLIRIVPSPSITFGKK